MSMKHLDELATLRAKVRALRLAFAHLPDTFVGLFDLDGVCLLNAGVAYEEVARAQEGRHFSEFIPEARLERFLQFFNAAKEGQRMQTDYPIGALTFEASAFPVLDERGLVQYVMTYSRDVTAERAARAVGARDSLTGLPKRGVLQAFVGALLRRQAAFQILFMYLDGFKAVNDSMGHKAGDIVLEKVSRAIQASIRSGDIAVRLGGDEFVIVFVESARPLEAAKRLLASVLAVTAPFGAAASIGLATYPDDGATLDELLAAADRNMYAAKLVGGASIR